LLLPPASNKRLIAIGVPRHYIDTCETTHNVPRKRYQMSAPRSRFLRIAWLCGLLFAFVLIAGQLTQAQQTTNTSCILSGNMANCTSTTVDHSAQQRQAYETGQQVGSAIGIIVGRAVASHKMNAGIRKYCVQHPGSRYTWRNNRTGYVMASGYCPSNDDKAAYAANEFVAHHKDYKPSDANSQALLSYINAHNLDPREKKTYERAYIDMKKAGTLELYSK
jgi:hypothetical protein